MLKVANSVINASQIKTPITFVGDVTLSTGNLVIGTAGKGIDFSVTTSGTGTMTSELLADYEEGTWTPVLTASGSGITNQVYATQSGTYTKVGRQVTVNAILALTSFTNTSGNYTRISGLPFTPSFNAGSTLQYENFTGGTNGQIILAVVSTDAQIYFQKTDSNGQVGATGVNSGLLQQTVALVCTATYFV